MSPGPATDFDLCPHKPRLEEWQQAGTCFGVLASKTQEQYPVATGAGNQATAVQFSAAPSTLRVGFPTPKPRTARICSLAPRFLQASQQFLILKYMDLQASQAPFFQGLGSLSPWAPASCFLGVWKVCLFKTLKARIIIYSRA